MKKKKHRHSQWEQLRRMFTRLCQCLWCYLCHWEYFQISLTRNRRNLTVRVKSIIALGNKLVIILFIFPFCIYWLHYSFLLINTWARNLRFDNTWCNIILHNLHDGREEMVWENYMYGNFRIHGCFAHVGKKGKKKKKENTKNNRIYSYNKVHFRNAQWNML